MRKALFIVLMTIAAGPARPELELAEARFESGSNELSGGTMVDGTLYVVADDPEDHYVYRVEGKDKRFDLGMAVDLTALDGWKAYEKHVLGMERLGTKDRRMDFEGLATCDGSLYVANERAREIIVIDPSRKALKHLPLDTSAITGDLNHGGGNAGVEGVAVDCANKVIYIAKEREPRRLYAFALDTGKLLRQGDVTPSDRAGQQVINPWTGQGLFAIGPDYSDLAFDKGFLYVIERNAYEITKVDPKTFEAVARVSYLKSEQSLYDTGEPFGTAEMLVMTPDAIYVGYDNNQAPLSALAQQKYGVTGPHGAIMRFKRPDGF